MRQDEDTTATVNITKSICNWILKIAKDTLKPSEIRAIKAWRDTNQEPHINELQKLGYNNGIPFGDFFLSKAPSLQLPKFANLKNPNQKLSRFIKMTILKTCNQRDVVNNYWHQELRTPIPWITSNKWTTKGYTAKDIAYEFINYFHFDKDSISVCNTFAKLRELFDDYSFYTMMDNHVPNCTFDNKKMSLDSDDFKGFSLVDTQAPMIFINYDDTPQEKINILLKSIIMFMNGKSIMFNKYSTLTKQQNNKLNQIIALIKHNIHYQSTNIKHIKRDYMFVWIIINMISHMPHPQLTYNDGFDLLNVKGTNQMDSLVEKLQNIYDKYNLVRMQFANEDRIGHLDVPA